MRNHILIDLDDTINAAWKREHMIEEFGWDVFHQHLVNDDPVEDILKLILNLNNFDRVGLTARPEKWRQPTIAWLVKHGLYIDDLLMRPDDDFRPSPIIKVALATEYFGSEEGIRENVAFIIDDRPDVIKAFAGIGITTLHINARRA